MSLFKFFKKGVPLAIIELIEIGVKMELNCELTKRVVAALQAKDINCYIVGGYVRDNILGIPAKDIDIELHNTTIEEAHQIISQIADAKVFGTFGVVSLNDVHTEFAIARTERKTGTDHTDFEVDFITDGDLKLAASRRDFTINSLMYDLQTNKLIDNYGGVADLENKLLRHVGPAFIEDPLRILRGLKFMARYDLQMVDETDELCKSIIAELTHLPKIRIQNELEATFNGKYYACVKTKLTEYFGLLLNQIPVETESACLDIDCNRLMFFKQYADYKTVVDFCYEQKVLKKDLTLCLQNYQLYVDFEKLEGETRYDLLAVSEHCLKYIKFINPIVLDYYNKYLSLSEKYNGQYFLNLGFRGKEIKTNMRSWIGTKLNEL